MNFLTAFTRLSLQPVHFIPNIGRTITTDSKLFFRATQCLLAEPLKKKKRIDPMVIKQREDRRKKKIEKQIRRLEKNARQLKPIEECEIPLTLIEHRTDRERNIPALSATVLEKHVLLEKEWAKYKRAQHLADVQMIDRISYSQQRALDELRKESEDLYQEAIQIDFQLIPFSCSGPVNTPPVENYEAPDGDYQDVSRKWE